MGVVVGLDVKKAGAENHPCFSFSPSKRNIGQWLTGSPNDVHRLVDEITYKKASEASDAATQSAILGPFYRHDTPYREKGATISFDTPKDAELVYMYGKVTDAVSGKPLTGADIQVWEASTNGESILVVGIGDGWKLDKKPIV